MIRTFALSCLLTCPALAQGSLTRIVGPNGPGYNTEFREVSGDGRVILVHSFDQGGQLFLLRDGVRSPVLLPNDDSFSSFAMSGNGRVVVAGSYNGINGKPWAWIDDGPATQLALPSVIDWAYATCANEDGSVIGGFSFSSSRGGAMRWINGVPSLLSVPNYGDVFSPYDISSDGWTMVGSGEVSSVRSAARWTELGGLVLLEAPPGTQDAYAVSQSADGRLAVGYAYTSQEVAALWDENGTFLSLHDPAWTHSAALDIDAAGTRVLVSAETALGRQAFLYDVATGTYTDLAEELSAAGGPNMFAHHLRVPQAMSADGNTFIGDQVGVPLQFEYWGWSVDVNSFGRKVCGPAALNSTGAASSLLGSGSLSVLEDAAQLTATMLPPGSFGMVLTSRTAASVQLPASSGTLCLGGQVGRFDGPGEVQAAGLDGTLSLDIQLSSLPTPSGSIASLPGETWFFQVWFRDSGTQSTNFTDALQVTLTQ